MQSELTWMSDGVAELQHGVQSCSTEKGQQIWVKNNKTIINLKKGKCKKDPPSSVRVWLEETPSVSVTTTEYLPRSSLSGLEKVSLELKNRKQASIKYPVKSRQLLASTVQEHWREITHVKHHWRGNGVSSLWHALFLFYLYLLAHLKTFSCTIVSVLLFNLNLNLYLFI